MKKLLLILICLFMSFEVRSDVLEDLSKTMNVSRLEYSLDKLIPEIKLEVFSNNTDFDDDSRYKYSEKMCTIGIGKIDFNEYKTDKETIVIGCAMKIKTQYMFKGKELSDEQISRNFNYLLDVGMELNADRVAEKVFDLLGNYGTHIVTPILLGKFNNKYNLDKFLRDSKVTEIQEDYANLLKERITLSVNIGSTSDDGSMADKTFFYPFSQKWERGKGRPKFEKIILKGFEIKGNQ